ncbi:M50 family metallopeptidase [Ferruginibacter sp.]
MNKKKNTQFKSLSFWVIMLVCLTLGFFAGKIGFSASAAAISKTTLITLALLFVPIFFIVIGIHEAGHALAGVWLNFDFRTYIVGPFMWDKEQTGWKFKWNKNVNTAGGLVVCLPVSTENLSKRFSIYAASGPIASLLLAALTYGIFRLISITGTGVEITAYSFFVISILSLVIFIATAIPMHIGGFSSDGARVLRLMGGGDKARFETLVIKIIADSTGGLRPKLLNINELTEAQILAKKLKAPFGVYLHGHFHQAAFDNGNIEKAEQHLLDYIKEADEIPQGIRNGVWLDAAFFYAFAKQDIDVATKYWNEFKPTAIIPKAQVFATEAAMSVLINENDISLRKIEASLNEIHNMIDKGGAVALQEKLLQLKDNIEKE